MENPLIPVRNPDKNSTERFNVRGENFSEKRYYLPSEALSFYPFYGNERKCLHHLCGLYQASSQEKAKNLAVFCKCYIPVFGAKQNYQNHLTENYKTEPRYNEGQKDWQNLLL